MKVVIIEDEPLAAKNLQRLLQDIDTTIEVIAVIDSVSGALKWLKSNTLPDLFFMDIQLSDGVSFDILSQISIDKPIIFTTAYDEYAIRAFKVNSIDYLLKPIDKTDLKLALDKYHKYYENSGKTTDINSLLETINKQSNKYKERFLVHHKSGLMPIPAKEVAAFYKDPIIYLLTTDGQRYVTDFNTVDEIEELVNPVSFYRANRQMLVNKSSVLNMTKHHTGKMELKIKGHESLIIDISREKAQEFRVWVED